MANTGMGVDFESLARMTKPEMLPHQYGGGAVAGLDFSRQRQRRDGFLARATEMAEQDARMKAMAAEEASSPEAVELRRLKQDNELDEERNVRPAKNKAAIQAANAALKKEENKPFVEAANVYANGEDYEGAMDYLRTKGKYTLEQHTFGIDEQKDRRVLKSVFKAAAYTPQFEQKQALEQIKGGFKLTEAALREAAKGNRKEIDREIAQMRIRAAHEMHLARLAGDRNKEKEVKRSLSQLASWAIENDDPETLSKVKETLSDIARGAAEGKASAEAAAQERVINNIRNKNKPTTKDKFEVGKVYEDDKKVKARYLGNGKWEKVQ